LKPLHPELVDTSVINVDRDSSVGIVTRYGLDGPGIEYRWGRGEILHTRPDRPCSPPSLLNNWFRSFPGVKQLGLSVDQPSPSSAEVKERVKLNLYPSPLWAFMTCSRVNFKF